MGLISGVSAEENSARDMRLKCVEASTHRVTKNTKIRAVIFFQQQAVSSAVSTHPEMTSLPKFTCKIPSACLSESSQACKYQHGLQATQVAMVALLDLSRTFFCKPLIEQKHQLILDGRLACYPRLKAQRCEQMT